MKWIKLTWKWTGLETAFQDLSAIRLENPFPLEEEEANNEHQAADGDNHEDFSLPLDNYEAIQRVLDEIEEDEESLPNSQLEEESVFNQANQQGLNLMHFELPMQCSNLAGFCYFQEFIPLTKINSQWLYRRNLWSITVNLVSNFGIFEISVPLWSILH